MDTVLYVDVGAVVLAGGIIVDHRSREIIGWVHAHVRSECFKSIVDSRLRLDVHVLIHNEITLVEANLYFTFACSDVELTCSI